LVSGDLWSICQGHDTMQIFECMCKKYPNLFSISEKVLSNQILDEFFNNKCYRRSEMIAQIIEWEKMNHHSNFDRENRGKIFINSVYDEYHQNNSDKNNSSFKNVISS
jgi:hypothetical protein